MLSNLRDELAPLLQGIIRDGHELMRQELALAKCEVRQDIKSAGQVAMSIGLGSGLAAGAGLLLLFSLVHIISWAIPEIPMWGSYLAVGIGLGVAAGAILTRAYSEAKELDMKPTQTIETMKENAKWIAQSL